MIQLFSLELPGVYHIALVHSLLCPSLPQLQFRLGNVQIITNKDPRL